MSQANYGSQNFATSDKEIPEPQILISYSEPITGNQARNRTNKQKNHKNANDDESSTKRTKNS